jgi:hypothetical protein
MKHGSPFGLAGLWENWKNPTTGEWERTFAIITVSSNDLVAQIHDRMPAILEPAGYERWLGPEPDPHDLLITYPSEPMTMWPIPADIRALLTLLFAGFPDDLLPSLRRANNLDGTLRLLGADGNTTRESAVYAAITLVGAVVANLTDTERQAAIEALARHDDPNNPVSKGFRYMLHVVEQLGAKPALLSRMSYEIVGHLHGICLEAIQAWWTETEVPRLVDDVLQAEASAQVIAQRFAPRTPHTTAHHLVIDQLKRLGGKAQFAPIWMV